MFSDLKVRYDFLTFKMFKKFDDGVSGIFALELVGVVQPAFRENVVESNGMRKLLMEFDFADAAHNVFFEGNNKGSVILIRDV